MTGILILLVIALWGAFLFCVGYLAALPLRKRWIRALVGVAVTAALFTLPVRDELKGGEEFEALCRVGGVYQISPNAAGKKLDLLYRATPYQSLTGYARPVKEKTITYVDVQSGEIAATAKAYAAGGGWLVRHRVIALTSTDGPLIGRGECYPSDPEEARRQSITNRLVN